MSLLEKAWDKGAWCVIAVVLVISIKRVALWLKPYVERAFDGHHELIASLKTTTQQHAEANTANALANAENANVLRTLKERPACRAAEMIHGPTANAANLSATG